MLAPSLPSLPSLPSPGPTQRLKHVAKLGQQADHTATKALPNTPELERQHVRQFLTIGLGSAFLARSDARAPRLSRASRAQRRGKAKRVRVALQAEGSEGDPLLAEAKAAAEAAKLQLEAAKLRQEAEEMRQQTALAQRRARAVRLLGSEDVPGIGHPGSTHSCLVIKELLFNVFSVVPRPDS